MASRDRWLPGRAKRYYNASQHKARDTNAMKDSSDWLHFAEGNKFRPLALSAPWWPLRRPAFRPLDSIMLFLLTTFCKICSDDHWVAMVQSGTWCLPRGTCLSSWLPSWADFRDGNILLHFQWLFKQWLTCTVSTNIILLGLTLFTCVKVQTMLKLADKTIERFDLSIKAAHSSYNSIEDHVQRHHFRLSAYNFTRMIPCPTVGVHHRSQKDFLRQLTTTNTSYSVVGRDDFPLAFLLRSSHPHPSIDKRTPEWQQCQQNWGRWDRRTSDADVLCWCLSRDAGVEIS